MEVLILIIFIVGYAAVAFEHGLKINKAASALLIGVFTWTIYILMGHESAEAVNTELGHHLNQIAQILFFLLGAMTIVEIIDSFGGFEVITRKIKTTNKVKLLWVLSWVAFFLAALIDSVPAAVVMYSLIKKLSDKREDRLMLGAFMILAVNSGGVWSPLGNLPTLMLWTEDKISIVGIVVNAFPASVVSLLAPLTILSFMMKGNLSASEPADGNAKDFIPYREKLAALVLGLGGLAFVPAFKTFTHLPPFMGMLLALGVLWLFTEISSRRKEEAEAAMLAPASVLARIDTPSILFFLGILLSVAALEVSGLLGSAAQWLDANIPNRNIVNVSIGLLSAVVDNVPLVAATIEMYPHQLYPELGTDAFFWQFMAYTAGTGGSILIIGSAAGVATMGITGIEFFWYVKRVSWLALIGYFAGVGVFLLQKELGLLLMPQ